MWSGVGRLLSLNFPKQTSLSVSASLLNLNERDIPIEYCSSKHKGPPSNTNTVGNAWHRWREEMKHALSKGLIDFLNINQISTHIERIIQQIIINNSSVFFSDYTCLVEWGCIKNVVAVHINSISFGITIFLIWKMILRRRKKKHWPNPVTLTKYFRVSTVEEREIMS